MNAYNFARGVAWYVLDKKARQQADDYWNAAVDAGKKLRQRYNRYYYTGSLKQKYFKPVGVTPSIAYNRTNTTRTVARKTVRRMPMRYSKRPRRFMRRRRVYRRRYSKKARWQARARRQVGMPRNFSTTKTTESVLPGSVTIAPTKFVSGRPLIIIGGTTSNNVNARQRYCCVVSGIKIDATFLNGSATARTYINWAIVHGKQGQTISDTTPDFFRDYTSVRAFNANDTATKTGLTYSVAQINTDEFIVLKRGKFMLTPQASGAATRFESNYNYGSSTKEISHYLKLGRTFYFDDNEDTPQDQIYFVCWASNPNEGTGTTNDVLNYRMRAIVYWREPRQA